MRREGAVTHEELVRQLRALGVVDGTVLLVHTSFRAVGPVEGGPEGLVDALQGALGPGGTLVMPSWPGDDGPFDPATSESARDLGVVASTFWRLEGVRRSDHPFAFAARGPHAESIVAGGLPIPPHGPESPVGRVLDLDGRILLLGVNHDADTTVHLAEVMAGVPYRVRKHVTVLEGGVSRRIVYGENDHCCLRFALVDGWLREAGLQREGVVGHAQARLARARDVVDAVVPRLGRDPFLFLHPEGSGCPECDEAHRSVKHDV